MRTIRISINPPKIPENADYDHESTSWQVSKTPDFNDGDILVESLEDEDNLIEYRFSVDLDYYKTVYTRAKIHLSDGRSGEWTRPTTVTRNQEGFKYSNNIVLTPITEMDVILVNGNEYVEFQGDTFRMFAGVGKHLSTDWILEDSDGNIIYQRLEDKINLTTLRTDEIKLEDNKLYILKVAYRTDSLAISNYGKKAFYNLDDVKYCLDFKRQYFLKNKNIIIPFDNKISNIKYLDVILEEMDGTPKIILEDLSYSQKGLNINFEIFKDRNFRIKYRAKLVDGTITPYLYYEITRFNTGGLTEKDDIEYNDEIVEIESFEDELVEGADIHTMELKNGIIPFYANGEITPTILTYDYYNKKFNRGDKREDLTLNVDINTIEQVTAITETNTNYVLISYYLKNNEETFLDVFEYLPENDSFRIVRTFKIENALKGSRGVSQLLPLNDSIVVFTIWDNEDDTDAAKRLYILNLNTLQIESILIPGDREKQIGIITYRNNVLVYGGIYTDEDGNEVFDQNCYRYSFDTKEWTEVTYLNPDDNTFEIAAHRLKSGDYILYANYYKESTNHTDKRWWKFQEGSEVINIVDGLELPDYVYENLNDDDRKLFNFSILLSDGTVLLNYVEKEPNTNKLRSFMYK